MDLMAALMPKLHRHHGALNQLVLAPQDRKQPNKDNGHPVVEADMRQPEEEHGAALQRLQVIQAQPAPIHTVTNIHYLHHSFKNKLL
jgi:hypothetical protein